MTAAIIYLSILGILLYISFSRTGEDFKNEKIDKKRYDELRHIQLIWLLLLLVPIVIYFGKGGIDQYKANQLNGILDNQADREISYGFDEGLNKFYKDSSYAAKDSLVFAQAIYTLKNYTCLDTDSSLGMKNWLIRRGIKIDSIKFVARIENAAETQRAERRESMPTTPADDELHTTAYIIAKGFVKDNLKSPSSASFWHYDFSWSKLGNHKYYIHSYVDADNSYGANIKTEWKVQLEYSGSGDDLEQSNWKLLDIKIDN